MSDANEELKGTVKLFPVATRTPPFSESPQSTEDGSTTTTSDSQSTESSQMSHDEEPPSTTSEPPHGSTFPHGASCTGHNYVPSNVGIVPNPAESEVHSLMQLAIRCKHGQCKKKLFCVNSCRKSTG